MAKKPIYIDSSIKVYTDTPDFRKLGFAMATLVSNWGLFKTVNGEYDTTKIDFDTCRLTAENPVWWDDKKSDMIVLDEEYLPAHSDDLCERDLVHDQLIEAVRIYREVHPGVAIGYYSRLPELNFYGPLIHAMPESGWGDPKYYAEWTERNKQFFRNVNNGNLQVHRRGVCSQVDRVFPGVYQHWQDATHVDPLQVWKIVHDGNIKQAEQYQKPIMPYLSPRFAGSGEYFAPGIWKQMLKHSLNHPSVDGVVVFDGQGTETPWNESAQWWKETLEIVKGVSN